MPDDQFNRREVLAGGAQGMTSAAVGQSGASSVPQRMLGRTGQNVSCFGLGGSHIGSPTVSEGDAIKVIRSAIDHGLTFMDNCWDYHDGESERRMGKALRDGYRQKPFS